MSNRYRLLWDLLQCFEYLWIRSIVRMHNSPFTIALDAEDVHNRTITHASDSPPPSLSFFPSKQANYIWGTKQELLKQSPLSICPNFLPAVFVFSCANKHDCFPPQEAGDRVLLGSFSIMVLLGIDFVSGLGADFSWKYIRSPQDCRDLYIITFLDAYLIKLKKSSLGWVVFNFSSDIFLWDASVVAWKSVTGVTSCVCHLLMVSEESLKHWLGLGAGFLFLLFKRKCCENIHVWKGDLQGKKSTGKKREALFNKIGASKGKTWKGELMLRSKPLVFGVLYRLVFI